MDIHLYIYLANATLPHLDLPGILYIRILQLAILPLIVINIITRFASLNPRMNKKMSGATLAYIFAFNCISSLIGLTYTLLIKPANKACVLFCSVAFSLTTNAAKAKGTPFRDFFASLGEVVIRRMQKFLPIIHLPKCYDACDFYGIPKAISWFVFFIVGTMKNDASAILIVGAVFYVAQAISMTLDIGKAVSAKRFFFQTNVETILATAYVAASPNIPSAIVAAAITILTSIGVDPRAVSLLYAVEWPIQETLYYVCEKDFKHSEEADEEFEIVDKTHFTAF
ncbi:Excitatory amino acid transporter 2 [Taenia solium]|eukprot:TsM_000269900 transcript=TsM_000269900 gene=TsM_000269900